MARKKPANTPAAGFVTALGLFLLLIFFESEMDLFLWIGAPLLAIGVPLTIWTATRAGFERKRLRADVDGTPWREFAEGIGLAYRERGPRIEGAHRGVAVRFDVVGSRRMSTRVRAAFAEEVPARLSIREAAGRIRTSLDRPSGDPAFDKEFRVACQSASLAKKAVNEIVRAWVSALGDVEVLVKGRTVRALVPGFEKDQDRLRGLLELVVELVATLA